MAGTVAVITEGAGPLGQAVARRLGAACTHVLLADASATAARPVLDELARTRQLHGLDEEPAFVRADATSEDGARTVVHAALDRFGRVDVVVHVATLELQGADAPALDVAPLAPMTRWAAAALSLQAEGNLVLGALVRDRWPGPLTAAAREAASAAFGGFVHAAAQRLYDLGLCVNGLQVEDGAGAAERTLELAGVRAQQPSPALYDAAQAARFLASPEARGVSGQVLYLSGDRPMEGAPYLRPPASAQAGGYGTLLGSIHRLAP